MLIFPLRDVDILLGHQAGLRFLHVGKPRVGQMSDGIFRLGAVEFLASSLQVAFVAVNVRLVLLELLLQLGDFQVRQNLPFLDVRSPIHVKLLHVTGNFGVYVDFLVGQKLRRNLQTIS